MTTWWKESFRRRRRRLTRRERYDEVDGVGRTVSCLGWLSDENFRGWWLIKRGASNWQTGTTERPVGLHLLFAPATPFKMSALGLSGYFITGFRVIIILSFVINRTFLSLPLTRLPPSPVGFRLPLYSEINASLRRATGSAACHARR